MADFYSIQTQTGWRRALESFAEWCHPQTGCLALDIGSGPGLFPVLLRARGCRAWGADLDYSLLRQNRLRHPFVQADARLLPFPAETFHLVSASNLLFFLPEPGEALSEMARLARPGGQVCLLNPSEHLSVESATALAKARDLQGIARHSLIEWARRAENYRRWSESEIGELYRSAGLLLIETALKIGPGLARFARGIKPTGGSGDQGERILIGHLR